MDSAADTSDGPDEAHSDVGYDVWYGYTRIRLTVGGRNQKDVRSKLGLDALPPGSVSRFWLAVGTGAVACVRLITPRYSITCWRVPWMWYCHFPRRAGSTPGGTCRGGEGCTRRSHRRHHCCYPWQ